MSEIHEVHARLIADHSGKPAIEAEVVLKSGIVGTASCPALEKVSEIESVVKGEGSKKSKWEKIKPILTWLADKSFDVAMTILPLLLQVQG